MTPTKRDLETAVIELAHDIDGFPAMIPDQTAIDGFTMLTIENIDLAWDQRDPDDTLNDLLHRFARYMIADAERIQDTAAVFLKQESPNTPTNNHSAVDETMGS